MNPVKSIISKLLPLLFLNGIAELALHAQAGTNTESREKVKTVVNIEVVPNRPTFSTTAEPSQRGIFEIEYGLELADGHQNINGLLKFSLTKDVEVRFANIAATRDDGVAGFGDSGAGFKLRFLKQQKVLPTASLLYMVTIPTATADLGLGAAAHSAGLLFSKDFGKHHLDFNESIQWLPQPDRSGFDHNYFTAISYSHPITEEFGFSEEVAGFSRTRTTDATLTILQTLTYSISPRLVLDSGFYVAGAGDLPRVTFFAGVTYAVGDLYRHLRGRR